MKLKAGAFFLSYGLVSNYYCFVFYCFTYFPNKKGVNTIAIGRIDGVGDVIPVDMVVYTIIAASVYCADNPKELKVFNAGSSYSNPVTWKAVRSLMVSYYRTHPTKRTVFTPDFFVTDNYFLYELFFTLGYRVPLTLNKIVSIATGNQKMKDLSRKGDKMVDLSHKIAIQFIHFVRYSWVFSSKNTERLFTLLPEEEKKSFCFDAKKINWPLYLKSMCWGLNTYVIKDKSYSKPNEERLAPLYFERRFKSVFTDIRWACFNSINLNYVPTSKFGDLYQNILTSKKVKLVIESISRENNISKKSLELQSKKILETMRGDFHMPLLRFLVWFFRKIYRAMYENILIDERGLFALQSTMKEISEKSIPLVLLPTQRSYLDFMIITYLMFGKKIFSLILIF